MARTSAAPCAGRAPSLRGPPGNPSGPRTRRLDGEPKHRHGLQLKTDAQHFSTRFPIQFLSCRTVHYLVRSHGQQMHTDACARGTTKTPLIINGRPLAAPFTAISSCIESARRAVRRRLYRPMNGDRARIQQQKQASPHSAPEDRRDASPGGLSSRRGVLTSRVVKECSNRAFASIKEWLFKRGIH